MHSVENNITMAHGNAQTNGVNFKTEHFIRTFTRIKILSSKCCRKAVDGDFNWTLSFSVDECLCLLCHVTEEATKEVSPAVHIL